jgi:hypothetical protein
MRKIFPLTILIISAVALAGCGYTPEQRGVSGAALGGATGAAIGAVVGAATAPPPPPPPYYGAPPPRCARFAYDAYGNQYCAAYYRY